MYIPDQTVYYFLLLLGACFQCLPTSTLVSEEGLERSLILREHVFLSCTS